MTSEIPQAAQAAHDRAGECIQERRFVDSIVHAETAVRLCPDWAAPWWNLTVGYKHARRWADALEACDRAIALAPNDAEGPHWNAGIAATALGRWDRARAAWAASGIKLPAGDGPIDMNIGPTPIRISPDDKPEVVWCARIDPCRARIRSVPLPDSGRRHDDLLLHDGEARGRRRHGEVTVPVFDELEVLEASTYATWEVTIRCPDRAELEELLGRSRGDRAPRRGLDREHAVPLQGLQPGRAARPRRPPAPGTAVETGAPARGGGPIRR